MKSTCGCCAGTRSATPVARANRPGLSELSYRVGTYASFFEAMRARLSSLTLEVPSAPGSAELVTVRPLARLTSRAQDDAAIALLDAWAVIADVLTFYQERIANEGFLGTARERRSLAELAKLIGYRARPGVAASVYLAFDAALGFDGVIPKGTRAQSVAAGSTPQFFEISEDLRARYAWNRLAPRATRPQLITPPSKVSRAGLDSQVVTGADVVDTVYVQGVASNVKTGEALLFVFDAEQDRQFLRQVETVDVQASDLRTEITLAPIFPAERPLSASALLSRFVEQARYLFPGSGLSADVEAALTGLIANLGSTDSGDEMADFVRATLAGVREKLDIAVQRNFSRMAAWGAHLVRALELIVTLALSEELLELNVKEEGGHDLLSATRFVPQSSPVSPLDKLSALVDTLALAPSVQPANAKRLVPSLARSFSPQSDNAPRLLATLKPRAARTLYAAWSAVETPGNRVELHVARAKASLFAHNFVGKPTVNKDGTTTFTPPTLGSAWGIGSSKAPPFVALDSTYDQIKPGSWVVIDRPEVSGPPLLSAKRTYHRVAAIRSTTLDAGGFTAKVSLLALEPPWLNELLGDDLRAVIGDEGTVRGTLVYAQTEPLSLAEEPLDTDLQGNRIELADAYDGLEPGRFVIVSGERTDLPNVTGVSESELVMIAGVEQGAAPLLSVDFPLAAPPFSKVFYTTSANAFGDRLVVGQLADGSIFESKSGALEHRLLFDAGDGVPFPEIVNQQYRDQVELAPGFYSHAYVPSLAERVGVFLDFVGLLVDPETGAPLGRDGLRGLRKRGLFAWRVPSRPAETVLTLAAPLAYKYDTRSVKIYGNVTLATHGQTTGEVLGDGDAASSFQSFALRQAPLTYVSAPTPAGAESTLEVRVNELEWHERPNLAILGPRARGFVTEGDGAARVTFGNGEHGARLPTARGNVKASYRYGLGKSGNVKRGQISQLATQPLGLQGVQNPLPASGGADPDTDSELRRNAPIAVMALDRLVSIDDYAAFARSYAGIGKANAVPLSDGRRRLVHLTIAGKDDIPIDATSLLYQNLGASLARFGDPSLAVAIGVRRCKLLVVSAAVSLLPDYGWENVEPELRAAMLAIFGFDRRELGQPAFLSEAVAGLQNVPGVSHVNVERFDSVAENVSASELASLAKSLRLLTHVPAELAKLDPSVPLSAAASERVLAAELAYLTPDIPETMLLRLVGA